LAADKKVSWPRNSSTRNPPTARKRREKCRVHAALFLLLIAPCFFLAEDAGENFVDVFRLAVEIEGVFDLFARDFGGDFFVGEDQVVEV